MSAPSRYLTPRPALAQPPPPALRLALAQPPPPALRPTLALRVARWPALAALLLATATASCGSDDEAAGPTAPYVTPVPLAGCESFSYAVCNIVDAACQTQWDALVGCLRGAPAGPGVPVRVISEADFAAELRQNSRERPPPNLAHWERALTQLGLVAPGAYTGNEASDDDVTNIAAYYSLVTKSITVIDHGGPADGIGVNTTFVHELVHAAQDRELGLKAYHDAYATSFDTGLASDALVEGEADLYMAFVNAALNGIDLTAIDLASLFAARAERGLVWAFEQESAYLAADIFPYGSGSQYLYQPFASGGPEAVRAHFASPPSTTRRVLLHDVAGTDAAPVDFGAAPEVPGYELMFEDTLGALGVMLFVKHRGLTASSKLVEPFRSDHLYVYGSGASTALVWRLAFASVQSGDTFQPMAQAVVGGRSRVTRDAAGNMLVLGASDDAGLAAVVEALGLEPLR
jgi:hypothetical protein